MTPPAMHDLGLAAQIWRCAAPKREAHPAATGPRMTPSEQSILDTICDAGEPMSQSDICIDTGYSLVSVKMGLNKLEARGLIRRAQRMAGRLETIAWDARLDIDVAAVTAPVCPPGTVLDQTRGALEPVRWLTTDEVLERVRAIPGRERLDRKDVQKALYDLRTKHLADGRRLFGAEYPGGQVTMWRLREVV